MQEVEDNGGKASRSSFTKGKSMTKKASDAIQPIKVKPGPGKKANEINELASKSTSLGPPLVQEELFQVEKQAEVNGVEMGVLDNGIPYLTESGLAEMCGIDRKVLNRLAIGWHEEKLKDRGAAINEMLEKAGYFEAGLYLKSELNGSPVNAYTEPVCMALLEYYAFIAKEPRQQAVTAFRTLARTSFRILIYKAVGYSPEQRVLDSWRHFHDRVDLTHDAVPFGYFGVFREISIMIVPMIRSGILISDKVVPDISVGRAWSEYWEAEELGEKYGDRTRYDHDYPDYYPQAKSNPQHPYAYPNAALGEFREWLQKNYIANKFPVYMLGQTKKGAVPLAMANKALGALGTQLLEPPRKRLR